MTAKNQQAFDDGRRVHEEVRTILLAHVARYGPLARPPTAKAVAQKLSLQRDERTIRRHIAQILGEAASARNNGAAADIGRYVSDADINKPA